MRELQGVCNTPTLPALGTTNGAREAPPGNFQEKRKADVRGSIWLATNGLAVVVEASQAVWIGKIVSIERALRTGFGITIGSVAVVAAHPLFADGPGVTGRSVAFRHIEHPSVW